MSKFNPYLSPKARFVEKPENVQQHNEMVAGTVFTRAIDVAVVEFSGLLAESVKNQEGAMIAGAKNQGVQQFIYILKGLGTIPPPPNPNIKVVDSLPGDDVNRRQ